MKLTGISKKVFLDRYSIKNKKGLPIEKKPEEMWRRVAKAASVVEKKKDKNSAEKQFYEALSDFKYVPGGRILAGAGTGYDVSFYNCFVLPSPKDSRGGIMEALSQMVEIMAHGGGVGINMSSLRPRGARVKKVNGFSSGPINWAELFSVATKDIIQQGGSRRGALMIMLWDWHPDIEEFITIKQNLTKINGANLSVCVSDSFMEAVSKDKNWDLIYPDLDDPEYDKKWNGNIKEWKELGKKVIVHKTVKARTIWALIARAAWRSAEPGVVFMERCNKLYNNWYWNKVDCVNPCGEEPLPGWGVCNLGSINLSAFVRSDDIDKKGSFDYSLLKKTVRAAVRLQDNIIDLDPYIFKEIRKVQLEGERRMGLGTMGLGDALIKMHLRYGSKESVPIIHKIYKTIRDSAYRASVDLAIERGMFPKFDSKYYPNGEFIKRLPQGLQKRIKKYGIRNSLLLTQAPTGTTSLLAGTTSGIEPVFEFEFIRQSRIGKDIIRHPLYGAWYKKHEKEIKEGRLEKPNWFVSANDLTPEEHVLVQGIIQYYVDASISKTVNAPSQHTVEDVARLYSLAYQKGCKGIAYMREGSRRGVFERKPERKKETKQETPAYTVKPRPMVVKGSTYRVKTPMGSAFITINTNGNEEPLEVFINVGKAGSDLSAMAEGLGRTISLALRFSSHMPTKTRVKEIIDQLSHIGGSRAFGFGKNRIRSLPDAIAKVLSMHYEFMADDSSDALNGKIKKTNKAPNGHLDTGEGMIKTTQESLLPPHAIKTAESPHFDICPECGGVTLVHEEGCRKCYSCGFSEC